MSAILYAAPLSLYSGKARAYLDWKGIAYDERLSSPDVYRDIIVPAVGRPVIPVLQTADGEIIQDTTCIIDHYEAAQPEPPVYPAGPSQRLAALLLEAFGDEWLVIPAMHYRWNYNEEWAYSEFGKVALPGGSAQDQYELGRKRAGPFRGSLPMLGVTANTIPAIEAAYESLLSDLSAHFARHDFLFGSRPSIGDLGLIGPLYAHLYRDPASGEIMERVAPLVAQWVRRMVDAERPCSGEFLTNDEVPETLLPVLARQMREQVPHLQHVANMLGTWAAASDEREPPRALGTAPFTTNDADGERLAFPYSLWMLQRALDWHRGLDEIGKAACDKLLHKVEGGEAFAAFDLPVSLEFTDHRLKVAR